MRNDEGIISIAEKASSDFESILKIKPKPRLQPINRQQLLLRPVDIEQLVREDHEVRAIWELTGQLDLGLYYKEIKAVEGVAGREPVDPRLLISLWIYSYSEGISSAREISRLCEYHPAYQWLTGMKPINHHTLSDFRVDHKEALDELFTEVLGMLSAEGLISLQRVMHDGTKIKAYAGGDSFRRQERLQAHLQMARQHVAEMGDPFSDEEISPRVAAARRRAAKEKQERLELALKELDKLRAAKTVDSFKSEIRVSESDPEARIMKQSNGGYAPSYNVQISTDAFAGVIVGVSVSQSVNDYAELIPAVQRIEDNLGKLPNQLVADGGFTSRANIIDIEQHGIDFIGAVGDGLSPAAGQLNLRGVDPSFRPDAFRYDAAEDNYTCPWGNKLRYVGKERRTGRTNHKYRANASECQGCSFKEKCCPQNKKGRSIIRSIDDPVVTAFKEKMKTEEAKQIYKQRGSVAEFTNAWIKAKIGLRQFRLSGLIKTGMEAVWTCLTYNIQQWIRLCWRVRWADN